MMTHEYYEEMYRFHAQTDKFKRQVEKSITVVNQFLEMGKKSTLNVSGGKDSVAMAHMVTLIDPTIKVVSEKDDMDFPNELEFMQDLQKRYGWDMDIITPSVSLWSQLDKFDITEDLHSKGTDFSDTYFYNLLREYQHQNQIEGVFLGLRAEESKGRRYNFLKNGHIYWNKSWQHWVCQPLAHWKGADVFAYLFSNDIPILDVYFKNKFAEPEQIRKSWILPSARASQGQAVWLKYYYPELFNRLSQKQAIIRGFV